MPKPLDYNVKWGNIAEWTSGTSERALCSLAPRAPGWGRVTPDPDIANLQCPCTCPGLSLSETRKRTPGHLGHLRACMCREKYTPTPLVISYIKTPPTPPHIYVRLSVPYSVGALSPDTHPDMLTILVSGHVRAGEVAHV
jgi:hypothetical protein